MLLWYLQDGETALMGASIYGHPDVVKHLLEYKADVNAKAKVIIALADGLFDSLIFLTFCDAAVVSAGWHHRANETLREWPH